MTWLDGVWKGRRRTRLGVKLGVLSAALTALVVCLSFLALNAEVEKNTSQLFARELSRDQRSLVELERRNLEQLLLGASLIATAPDVRAALDVYRTEANSGAATRNELVNTVQRVLERFLPRAGGDILLVTDESARVFASVARRGAAPARGMDLSRLPAMRQVLNRAARADTGQLAVLRQPDGLFQVAVYPLVLDGYTLGTVVLGARLDSGFVATARATFDGDVVVTAGSDVLISSLPNLAGRDAGALLASGARSAVPATVSVGGEDRVAAPVSLGRSQDNVTVNLWLLQPLTQTVQQLMRRLLIDFLLYGALAVAFIGIGAALIAQTVLRPFNRFVSFLRSGALVEHSDARFDDHDASIEVRTLNESFTQLIRSVTVKQQQLEKRTEELATSNAILTEEVRERERVEHALRESESQLRQSQKLEAIGTLAGGIAHDFNNLLTVISGYTQFALQRTETGSDAAEDLEQVMAASGRAAELTHQLLVFSRKQTLKPTVLDLNALVDGVAPMLERLIGAHIDLRVERSDALEYILADRGQLEQVIINLVVNARDAMPLGGTITIGTAPIGGPRRADPRDAPHRVALSVRDTGTGMPESVRERIFEPFFTTKEVGKGTGLGLSTVYGIVKQSGGTIEVESTLDVGTTFTVVLPAADHDAATGLRLDEPAPMPRGTESILLVEDDAAVRALTTRMLDELGYSVIAARGPLEALELAKGAVIDVLLTDVVMPQFSGPQLVARFLRSHPAPVVIYMSGYADDSLRPFGMDAGIPLIRKPFTPTTLARTVREAIDASALPGRVRVA